MHLERDRSKAGPQDWKQILKDVDRTASESILLLSEDLRILWANRVAVAECALGPDEVLGRFCYDVTHDLESTCQPPLHPCPVPELRRTGKPVTVTHMHSDRQGNALPVEIRAHPIKDSEEAGLVRIVHTSRGVTEIGWVEGAFRAMREALENRVERQLKRRNVYGLTFRELTVLSLVAAGKSDKEIAAILGISPLTAQKHVSNVLRKMKAKSRTQVGVRAIREGLVY